MTQDNDEEQSGVEQSLLNDAETGQNIRVTQNKRESAAGELMDIIIKKVKSSETLTKLDQKSQGQNPEFIIPKKIKRRALIMQVFMACLATFTALSSGMALGFPAITLQALTNQTISGPLTLNSDQGSWFASINTIACPFGGLFSAYILDKLGRKRTLILINFISIISWGIMAFASKTDFTLMYTQLLVARFLIGINIGLTSAPPSIYSAEISYPHIRGRLTLGTSFMIALGILWIYLFGYFFPEDWRLVSGISAAVCVVSLIALIPMPETPVYLASKGKDKKAEKSLKIFRGARKHETQRPDIMSELEQLQIQAASDKVKRDNGSSMEMLTHPEVYKPLLHMIALFAVQQFSGIFVIIVYAANFAEASHVAIDSFLAAVLIGVARVIATICIFFVMDKFGRKPPLLFSGIMMTICMYGLSAYNYFEISGVGWLPGLLLILFIFTSTIGFLSVPFAMIAEVFPRKARGLGAGLSITAAYFLFFVALKLYPTMVEYLDNVKIFGIYGTVSLIGVFFVHFILIETKGKTLEQIEVHFKNKNDAESVENDRVFQIS
uniref:CSON007562 protein n=1 Tax=Culicoides sonorensis TaxID=179676 RepID=A0A336M9V4_CULSO